MNNKSSNSRADELRASRRTTTAGRLGYCLTVLVLAGASGSCTKAAKKSAVRELQAGLPPLKQFQLKYAFIFIGSSGKNYPIYMNAEVQFNEDQRGGVWNSAIDSDGGLIAAGSEIKTLKPDKNLQLKSALQPADSATDPTIVVFSAGNPELGRGLSLSLQKVAAGGVPTWKAVKLSYFGYEAQIEDSSPRVQSASATPN